MAIQFLRGSGTSSTVLADGQPYYDKTNNLLYIGNGSTALSSLTALNLGKYLQTGYLYYTSSTYAIYCGLTFFTDTVYNTTDAFVNSFHTDHIYEACLASGPLWSSTSNVCSILALYVYSSSTLRIYYQGTSYSSSISSWNLSTSYTYTYEALSAKRY